MWPGDPGQYKQGNWGKDNNMSGTFWHIQKTGEQGRDTDHAEYKNRNSQQHAPEIPATWIVKQLEGETKQVVAPQTANGQNCQTDST